MIEGNAQGFQVSRMLELQRSARRILENVQKKVNEGMNYKDIEELIKSNFIQVGIEKSWHPIKVRIDQDTIKSFREKSDESIKVLGGSIYFIDIGVVKDGYEGDFGNTFVFGQSFSLKEELISNCKNVFDRTVQYWRCNQSSGNELYDYASGLCKEYGLELNLDMSGHRIGSYPHGVFYKGSLLENTYPISEHCWILEIQVMCPDLQLGAFYEDIIF